MMLEDADFDQQHDLEKWPELKQKIASRIKTKTRNQWCDILEGTDACFAPVLDYQEAVTHHHMQARQAYVEHGGKVQPAPSPRFSRTASEIGDCDESENQAEGQSIFDQWCH